jgi:hypothetical protein
MKLDPAEVQILVAHLQPHLVQSSVTEDPHRIKRSAGVLMRAAAELSIPVTFAMVPDEQGDTTPVEDVASFADDSNSFVAEVAAPFLVEDVRQRIDKCGRRIVIVSGVATEAVVLHSTIDAIEAGYRVFVPIDAIGSTSERAERAALEQIGRAGGEIMATATILSMLAPDFRQEPGTTILSLIRLLDD